MFLIYEVPHTSISTVRKVSSFLADFFDYLLKLRTFPQKSDKFDGGFDVKRKSKLLFVNSLIGCERSESNLDCKLHSFDCIERTLCCHHDQQK